MFYSFCFPPFLPYKNKQINTTASGYNAIRVEESIFPHVFQGMMIIIDFSFAEWALQQHDEPWLQHRLWWPHLPLHRPQHQGEQHEGAPQAEDHPLWQQRDSVIASWCCIYHGTYATMSVVMENVNWIGFLCFLIDFCCEKLLGSLHELLEAKCCAKVDTKNIVIIIENNMKKYVNCD